MTHYYIHDGIKELGPFTLIELTSQKINAHTPVWHRGLNGWTKAGDLDELQPLLAVKPSPPPYNAKKEASAFDSNRGIYLIILAIVALALTGGILLRYFTTTNNDNVPSVNSLNTTAKDSLKMMERNVENQRVAIELEAKKKNYRNNWMRYIWVENDDFKRGFFGGVYNLEVSVVNNTEYMLEEVNVLVHYIKENGTTYKIEPLELYNISAQGSSSITTPESNRGTSVKIEINAIRSKGMDFCYSGEIDLHRNSDPYRCKIN